MSVPLLTLGYLATFFIVVFARDAFIDDTASVFAVVASLLFAGLGLWIYAARKSQQ